MAKAFTLKQITESNNPTIMRAKKLTDKTFFKLCGTKCIDSHYVWLFNEIVDYGDDEVDIHIEQL
jgi:hypothetical protein